MVPDLWIFFKIYFPPGYKGRGGFKHGLFSIFGYLFIFVAVNMNIYRQFSLEFEKS